MRHLPRAAAAALALGAATGCGAPAPPEISVYAAVSLREALLRAAPGCESSVGARLVLNFGATSDLARQIESAGKADVFFAADETWMDHVARAGLVDSDSRRPLLSNRLVVVVPAGEERAIASPRDLAGPAVRRLALGDPEAVPAGAYAKAWLLRAGLWESVRDRVVPALDARAALAAVESGAADAGVVYRTDALTSRKVRVVHEVSEEEGPPISYPIAALRDRPRLDLARRLVDCLSGAPAAQEFREAGFIVLGDPP